MSRRRALSGAATVGLAMPVLAACAGESDSAGGVDGTPSEPGGEPAGESGSPSRPAEPTQPAEPTGSPGAEAPVGALLATADVPVGGGTILTDPQVVITQPTAGDFKAFTSICTHTQCPVTAVTTTIDCACHGSKFDITTGDVVAGPAPSALAEKSIVVKNGEVSLA